MAEFDESKVINSLHTERAEVGKRYYFEDYLHDLKRAVEGVDTLSTSIGILDSVGDDGTEPFQKRGGQCWEFIYPYEEPLKKRMTKLELEKENAELKAKIKKLEKGFLTYHEVDLIKVLLRNNLNQLWGDKCQALLDRIHKVNACEYLEED